MRIIFKKEYTDLNTYINAERTNRFIAAKIKKAETERAQMECKNKEPITERVAVYFHWYCTDTRKDPDNISFGAKFILDALVKEKVLQGDSWKHIESISHNFYVDKNNPRVEVILI